MASGDPGEGPSSQTHKRCFFGRHLARADTALTEFYDCDGVHTNFLTLDLDLREIIMARCCVKHVQEDTTICSIHQKVLGPRYYETLSANKKCLWPSHNPLKRNAKGLIYAFPESKGDIRKQSFYLFSTQGLLVPFQSKICPACKKVCTSHMSSFVEEKVETPGSSRRSTLGFGSPPSTVVGSQGSSKSYVLPDDEKRKSMRNAVDDLLAINKIKIAEVSHLKEENTFEGVSEERKRQLKDYAGAAVASVIQTFVKKDEDGLFWKELKD